MKWTHNAKINCLFFTRFTKNINVYIGHRIKANMTNLRNIRYMGTMMLAVGCVSLYYIYNTHSKYSTNRKPGSGVTVQNLRKLQPDNVRGERGMSKLKLQPYDVRGERDRSKLKLQPDDARGAPERHTLTEQHQEDIDVDTLTVNDQAGENITYDALHGPAEGIQDEKSNQTTVWHQRNHNTEEKRHIAFLKVHKAASTTLQTMFFRFGYERNLNFVFPVQGHYISSSPKNYKPLIPPLNGDHYDVICNHAFFNYTVYSNLMPNDTIYISVIRDPFRQFISAFHYYTNVYHLGYLMKIPNDPILNLIKHPNLYDRKLTLTRNSMARDLGFLEKHYNDETDETAKAYLEQLGTIFDLVLVAEHFDESLILMKRLLGWSLKDILYMSKNVRSPDDIVNDNLMEKFKKRNRLDYLVYHYFYNRFLEKIQKAGNDLPGETGNFKEILLKVQTWCDNQTNSVLNINGSFWNDPFILTADDCKLMSKKELGFIEFLKSGK